MIVRAQRHVGKLLDTTNDGTRDTLVPFPLNAPTGAHNFSETGFCYRGFKKCCGTCMRQKPSVLEPYGIGLVLYFKFLKLMTVIFLLMSLALAPSMYFYWMGSSMTDEDKALMISESFLNALFFTTIGSLGAGASACMEVRGDYLFVQRGAERSEVPTEVVATLLSPHATVFNPASLPTPAPLLTLQGDVSQVFDLKCPSGVFKSIEAHWGEPNGYCSCPAAQQPNDQGSCTGQKTFPYTAPWGECAGGPCWLSTTKLKESCCAKKLFNPNPADSSVTPDFTPDLTDVDITTNPTCYSPSAQFIASGMCLGRQNCTFPVSLSHNYTWTYDSKYDTKCDEDWDPATESVRTCTRSLMHHNYAAFSNFTDCPANRDNYKLVVIGLCAEEEFDVTFNGETYTFSKEHSIKYISYIDCGCAFLFLVTIYWMANRESDAIEESDSLNCSPSDYSVMISNLPKHQSLESLKLCLKTHFTEVLKVNQVEEDEKLRQRGVSAGIKDEEDFSIFDIQFSLNNRRQIYWKKVRGRVARLKDKMENEVVFLKQIGKFKGKRKAKIILSHKVRW